MRIRNIKTKIISGIILGAFSLGAAAGSSSCGDSNVKDQDSWSTTYNYYLCEDGINYSYDINNDNSVQVDGINIGVTTWSDTAGGSNDDKVVIQGTFDNSGGYSNDDNVYGYALTNEDGDDYGDKYDSHYIDNLDDKGSDDFDMVLLSFSEAVRITGAAFSHVNSWSSSKDEVTIVGFNDISDLTSGHNTWTDIENSFTTSDFYKSFSVTKTSDTYHSSFDFTQSQTAKYWLIGAYNSAFSNEGDDDSEFGFKLAALGFERLAQSTNNSADPINAPATLGLFSLALIVMGVKSRTKNRCTAC